MIIIPNLWSLFFFQKIKWFLVSLLGLFKMIKYQHQSKLNKWWRLYLSFFLRIKVNVLPFLKNFFFFLFRFKIGFANRRKASCWSSLNMCRKWSPMWLPHITETSLIGEVSLLQFAQFEYLISYLLLLVLF